jgi:hypothetical protein
MSSQRVSLLQVRCTSTSLRCGWMDDVVVLALQMQTGSRLRRRRPAGDNVNAVTFRQLPTLTNCAALSAVYCCYQELDQHVFMWTDLQQHNWLPWCRVPYGKLGSQHDTHHLQLHGQFTKLHVDTWRLHSSAGLLLRLIPDPHQFHQQRHCSRVCQCMF